MGAYALLIETGRAVDVPIGKARRITLEPGLYVYAGSAYGPGGIDARVARHLRRDKKRHWHVDDLTAAADRTRAFGLVGGSECDIITRLTQRSDFSVAAAGFGNSDCRACPSHLLRSLDPRGAEQAIQALGGTHEGGGGGR
jgi:Uri superfamily endonuclease